MPKVNLTVHFDMIQNKALPPFNDGCWSQKKGVMSIVEENADSHNQGENSGVVEGAVSAS